LVLWGAGQPTLLYVNNGAEALGGDAWDGELLPAGALLTGSEEYYPTVAINALMRSLRDAALSSQHFEVYPPPQTPSIHFSDMLSPVG